MRLLTLDTQDGQRPSWEFAKAWGGVQHLCTSDVEMRGVQQQVIGHLLLHRKRVLSGNNELGSIHEVLVGADVSGPWNVGVRTARSGSGEQC